MILARAWRSAEQETAIATGHEARGAAVGSPNVAAEVPTPELRADSELLRLLEDFGFHSRSR